MANWDITKDAEGNEFVEINGKLYPHRSMNAYETLNDPEAFEREMEEVRRDYARKSFGSIRALENVILD